MGRIIPWLKRWFEMVFFIIPNPNWTLDDANTKRLAKKCIVFIKSWNSHTKVERWILKSFIALEHGTVIKAFFALIYPSIFFFSDFNCWSFSTKRQQCNKTVLNVGALTRGGHHRVVKADPQLPNWYTLVTSLINQGGWRKWISVFSKQAKHS